MLFRSVKEQLAAKKKIMGIGHRVYKVLDPRAPHLKRMAEKLTKELGETKWIEMSERIATIMRTEKKLEAIADFTWVKYGVNTPLAPP